MATVPEKKNTNNKKEGPQSQRHFFLEILAIYQVMPWREKKKKKKSCLERQQLL